MCTKISESFIAIGWTVRALVGKVQHRVLQLVQFSNFFKFPKPPQECLQQLVKVSSQSDERCGLLYGIHTHRQTDRQTDIQTDIDFYIQGVYKVPVYFWLLVERSHFFYRYQNVYSRRTDCSCCRAWKRTGRWGRPFKDDLGNQTQRNKISKCWWTNLCARGR